MEIKSAWKLLVVNPSGEVVGTIKLEGYDLTKMVARVDIMEEIESLMGGK